MAERAAVHIGIAWKYRNWHHLENAVVHAVERPEGIGIEYLPDGRVAWNRPWIRVCDGGDADERRYGWTTDVTCMRCRIKLGVVDPDDERLPLYLRTLGNDEIYDDGDDDDE